MLALQPEHVQLFGNVHSVKTKQWKIAWGLELNNYKQNHLEPYATRGVTESPAVEQVDLVQAGQPLNDNATVDDGPENPAPRFEPSELRVAEDVPLKHWFSPKSSPAYCLCIFVALHWAFGQIYFLSGD